MSHTPPKRTDVLLVLWNRAQWLNNVMTDVNNDKRQITPKLKMLLYMCQVHAQLCKTVLYGLKDEDLEIRVQKLEEAIRNVKT